MDIFRDETDFTAIRMVRVVDMFESRHIQRIARLGLIAGMDYGDELDVTGEDDYECRSWVHGHNNSHGFPRLFDGSSDRGLHGSRTRSSSCGYRPSLHYCPSACDLPHPPSVDVQAKESATETTVRLLQEPKKKKGKAEKKRLKKRKQRERKRLEKEKKDPVKNEEEKDDAQKSQGEDSKPVNDESHISVKQLASAKDTDSSDSSEDESSDEDSATKDDSGDSEELDMTSTFVSKARRKLDQKPRPERREKKRIPVKGEPKTLPDKPSEDPEVEKKKDSAVPSSHTFQDNVKISTDLANRGNKFASTGNFNMAVKFFTDAIKYNPTEFKLFGNRSFCFEKMQEYEKALTDAELSLNMCPSWVKGLFRKGRALAGLKRYEQAAQAFREVLNLDSLCAEAAQELMRVQITQLMAFGFTREQSSNALIIHGTVKQALEVLSNLHRRSGAFQNGTLPLAQVANDTGVSSVLSANTNPVPPQSQDAPKTAANNKPLGPVQNMSNVQSQPKPSPNKAMKTNNKDSHPPQELFPVWVGNLVYPVTELEITNLFNKVGDVYSAKVLTAKRCAFVNFTKQESCDEAIRCFHGFELNGIKIAVRYPDRIPQGMGISKSALKADDLQDENLRQNEYVYGRIAVGSRRPVRTYRPVHDP